MNELEYQFKRTLLIFYIFGDELCRRPFRTLSFLGSLVKSQTGEEYRRRHNKHIGLFYIRIVFVTELSSKVVKKEL